MNYFKSLSITFFISLLMCLSVIFTGCQKQLEQFDTNPNKLTSSNFYLTAADANLATLGIYANLQQPIGFGLYGTDVHGSRSDELASSWDNSAFGQHTATSSYYVPSRFFQAAYLALFSANEVIEKVPAIDFDATTKNAYLGEAYFFRAFCHFFLLTNFRNIVPMLASPKSRADFEQAQAEPSAVWELIIADLQKAKTLLPPKSFWKAANIGRMNIGSATALLGKVYLYRAGIENKTADYASAAKEFDEVIKSGVYSLVPYGNNFNVANENNAESVMEFQYKGDIVNTSLTPGTVSTGTWFENRSIAPIGFPVQGDGTCMNNNWVFEVFKSSVDANGNIDSRAFGTLIFNDALVQKKATDKVVCFDGKDFAATYNSSKPFSSTFTATNRKWADFTLPSATYMSSARNNGVNYRYIRYADVLLMYAEAAFQSGYSGSITALAALNQVRARAGVDMPPLASIDMSVIEKERVLELTNEGHRFFDLLRWGTLASRHKQLETNDPYFKKYAGTAYVPFTPNKDEYYPIPPSEFISNPKMKTQNPGW